MTAGLGAKTVLGVRRVFIHSSCVTSTNADREGDGVALLQVELFAGGSCLVITSNHSPGRCYFCSERYGARLPRTLIALGGRDDVSSICIFNTI